MVPRKVMKITKKIAHLNAELKEAWKESLLTCKHCNQRQKMKNTNKVLDYYYVGTQECTGGDYWRLDRAYWECNKCGHQVNPFPDDGMGWRELKQFHDDSPVDLSLRGIRRKTFSEIIRSW